MIRTILFLFVVAIATTAAFVPSSRAARVISTPNSRATAAPADITLTRLYEKRRDASKSGTKRERLDRLAELEETRIETDKSAVLKGAGAFVGLILLLLVVAGASGVLDPVINGGY